MHRLNTLHDDEIHNCFISLTGLYNEQQNVIKKLKKETIETIGKVMISFIYSS